MWYDRVIGVNKKGENYDTYFRFKKTIQADR